MPYQLSWLVEGRIILNKSWGTLTKEEIPRYDQEMLNLLDAGTAPLVHCISDITELENMPGVTAMTQFTFVKHPCMGWQLAYGGKLAMTLIGNLASQIFRMRFRSFRNREEALAFLQQVDSTLTAEMAQNSIGAER
jgi:hypothetical protein